VYTWSTDQVDPRDRFDYWREVRAKGLFGVTAELESERRRDFCGAFSLRKLGNAGLIELRASPYHVERRAGDIANARSDSLCIYQQLGSGGWFSGVRLTDFSVRSGMFATSHADLPYRTAPLGDDGFHLRILKVPAADIPWPHAGLEALVAKPVQAQTALLPLLDSCFRDLVESDDTASANSAQLVQALAHFALMERGVMRPGGRLAQQALRTGRLSLAHRLIERYLSRPALSPTLIADILGISVRHLHILFETSAMSFSQTVAALRIDQSRRLLRDEPPERPIAEIAFACGFESLATFYRVFNAAEGMTPGDYRSQSARVQ
jgi:AraC-like DNA-binding protein